MDKKVYKKTIKYLLESCGKRDWDGEGADPVLKSTVSYAIHILDIIYSDFPKGVDMEISADCEGNIEFDWFLKNGTMFTISIGHNRSIAVSGLSPGQGTKDDKISGMQYNTATFDNIGLLMGGLLWLRVMQKK